LSVDVDSDLVLGGLPVHLTATIDDGDNGGNGIAAAEYYVDVPPWDGGVAHPMSAADGAFGNVVEDIEASVSTAGWVPGRHMLFVRGRDLMNNWGPVSAVFVETDVDSFIDGHVTDADTALPIPAVDLAIEGPETYLTTTNTAGYYRVPVLTGSYDVTASAFGYDPETASGVVANNGMTTTQDFVLTIQPTGTLTGQVSELGTNAPLQAHVVAQGTPVETDTDASGAYSLALPQGVYTIVASAPGHEDRAVTDVSVDAGQSNDLDILLPTPACVLLVDDDYSSTLLPDTYEEYYIASLRAAGIDYDVWNVRQQGFPSSDDLEAYPALVWFTGDVPYGTLNITERTALSHYLLDDGGGLWLSGQNIAADLDVSSSSFLHNILGASLVDEGTGGTSVIGHDLFAGLSLSLAGGTGAGNQDSPDVISAQPGATAVLSYTAGGAAGVAVDANGYRSLFASFGIEGVADAADRQTLLADGLAWLGCSTAPVDLRIVMSGPASPVVSGELVTYDLTLDNYSAIPLSGLVVSDTLPAELDFVSASSGGTFDGTYVRWTDLSLPAEGHMQLTLQARVKAGVMAGTIIRNAEYGARPTQLAAPVMGTEVVETAVAGMQRIFVPLILRSATD
ncbi:MAG: carboxypeptidase regulatory-like domain-containing protein, partial [Anaerolineae bacterium]